MEIALVILVLSVVGILGAGAAWLAMSFIGGLIKRADRISRRLKEVGV